MTIHVADIASYQGALSIEDLAAASFSGINVKVSHGLEQKSVHPKISVWLAGAESLGWQLSSFHWLTGDADGAAQADYAYSRMLALDLHRLDVWHAVDVEDGSVTEDIYRSYVERMTGWLQRPIFTYSGDWWHATHRWLRRSIESPWLWSAPVDGYLAEYPGDEAPDWDQGYGGWGGLTVMQYRVAEMADIPVSQSAFREGVLHMPNSQNGWPVIYDRNRIDNSPILGMTFPNGFLKGDVWKAFNWLWTQMDRRVEPIDNGTPRDEWGYNVREIEGSDDFSNHSSGTAGDYNARFHPMGVRNTYSAAEREEIHQILEEADGIFRWGGDYTGRPDDMHFEVIKGPAAVRAFVAKIEREDMTPAEMTAYLKSAEGKEAMCRAVFNTDGVIAAPAGSDPANPYWAASSYVTNIYAAAVNGRNYAAEGRTSTAAVLALLQAGGIVDVEQLAAAIVPTLSAAIIAELPEGTLTEAQVEAAAVRGMTEVFTFGTTGESA